MSGCARRGLEAACRGGRFRRGVAPVLSVGAGLPAPGAPREGQKRFVVVGLLIGCIGPSFAGNARATSWMSAKFPGEQNRAVQGCADDAQNPGDWFCIFVRCEQPRSPLTLHFSTPGPDIHGDVKLVIDEETYAVSVPASLK